MFWLQFNAEHKPKLISPLASSVNGLVKPMSTPTRPAARFAIACDREAVVEGMYS